MTLGLNHQELQSAGYVLGQRKTSADGVSIGRTHPPIVNEGDERFHIAHIKSDIDAEAKIDALTVQLKEDVFLDEDEIIRMHVAISVRSSSSVLSNRVPIAIFALLTLDVEPCRAIRQASSRSGGTIVCFFRSGLDSSQHSHTAGGQTHKIIGTATSTMMTCKGKPTTA